MIKVTQQSKSNNVSHDHSAALLQVGSSHHYKLAGMGVVFQSQVNSLSRFKEKTTNLKNEMSSYGFEVKKLLNQTNAALQYKGMAQFEELLQQVTIWRSDGRLQINVSGQAICYVDIESKRIHVLNNRSFDERLNLEVVTGPALITLIAQLGTFCLHAGAVSTPHGNILIIGESGLGKSTLSAHAGEGWQQLTDDISPIVFKENSYQIENYPQLKLNNNVATQAFPEQSTIDLIIRLDGTDSDQVNFEQLNKTDALLQLVRHTVAAKLFDANIMVSHTEFAFNITSSIPMVQLSYPRGLSKLGELRESICDYLRLGECN